MFEISLKFKNRNSIRSPNLLKSKNQYFLSKFEKAQKSGFNSMEWLQQIFKCYKNSWLVWFRISSLRSFAKIQHLLNSRVLPFVRNWHFFASSKFQKNSAHLWQLEFPVNFKKFQDPSNSDHSTNLDKNSELLKYRLLLQIFSRIAEIPADL